MTEVNCRIHEYLCNYVLPHFYYQSLIIGKDLIAVFYFSVIACNVWYFGASTFCNSAANLTNGLLRLWILFAIIYWQYSTYTTLSFIIFLEILKKYSGSWHCRVIILHLYKIESLNISIIYSFAPPCPRNRSIYSCFDVKLIWILSSEFCKH